MNKYLEALEGAIERSSIINNCCQFVGECIKSDECKYNDAKLMCDDYVCFKTLQELVDKDTPKKVIVEGFANYSDCFDTCISYEEIKKCPNCQQSLYDESEEVDLERYDYCPYCGQALDWSMKNDYKCD